VVLTGIGDAAHDLLRGFWVEFAGGKVVHEEHGRGALHGDVVHAVIDQIPTDGVMQVHLEGDLQLGAYTVNAADQYRVEVLLLVDGEESAETADVAEHTLIEGAVRQILNSLLGPVGALDIHAGIGVGDLLVRSYLFSQVSGPSNAENLVQESTYSNIGSALSPQTQRNSAFDTPLTLKKKARPFDRALVAKSKGHAAFAFAHGSNTTLVQLSCLSRKILYPRGASSSASLWLMTKLGSISPRSMRSSNGFMYRIMWV